MPRLALSARGWAIVAAIVAFVAIDALALWGYLRLRAKWIEQGREIERSAQRDQAAEQYRESVRIGSGIAATARAEADAARTNADRLQKELRQHARHGLLVAQPDASAAVAACAGPAGRRHDGAAGADDLAARPRDDLAGRPGAGAGGAGDQALPPELLDEPRLELSAAALGVWNSALAGAPVPAGACGTAGAPERACAAATGVALEDAWGNHIENAARCRIDRQRLAHLIDFLRKREGAGAPNGD
jgi:hypothetical protein